MILFATGPDPAAGARCPATLSASVDWPAVTEAFAAFDVAASRQALNDLRHARRHNHRDAVHWVDALYRVYIGGLCAIVAVVVGTGLFGDHKLTDAETAALAASATPCISPACAA